MAAKPEKEETVFDIKEAAAGAAALPVFTPVNPGTYVANDGLTDKLKVTTIQQGNKLLFYPVIHYDSALANIKPEFKPALDYMADILKAESSPIIIEGHTDNLPIKTKKYPSNYELSLARANSVKNYLVKHKGIAASRITVTGYGDSKPLVVNNTEINRYKNRRAQVVVITVVSEPAAKNTPVNVKVSVQNPANAAAPSNTPAVTAAVTPAPATTPETAAPVKVQFNSNSQKSIGW
jgi:flagellar motor protein MotB